MKGTAETLCACRPTPDVAESLPYDRTSCSGQTAAVDHSQGHDFADRFPLAAKAVAKLPVKSSLIDGEAIVCDANGLSVFDLLRRRWHGEDVILCAFDLLELDGKDMRRVPIEERKSVLAKLLRRERDGIAFNEHYSGDGAIIYRHACELGCELG